MVTDAFVDPARVHHVSLKLVLHICWVAAPDFRKVAVFKDNIICTTVICNNLTTALKDSSSDTLDEVKRLSCIGK